MAHWLAQFETRQQVELHEKRALQAILVGEVANLKKCRQLEGMGLSREAREELEEIRKRTSRRVRELRTIIRKK